MKKKYIVPDLYFESFVLSQSIAAGCSSKGIGTVEMWLNDGYFTSSVPSNHEGITECVKDYDEGEYYCYWSGSEKLFLS